MRVLNTGVAAGVLMLGMARTASAQRLDDYINANIPGFDTQPGVTVASRLRKGYDYQGLRMGDFTVLPELNQSIGFDSNVTGTKQPQGSGFSETQGSVQATSNWGRDSLGGLVSVDNNRFFSQPRQSYTNWTASAGGTYEIGRDVLYAGFTHLNLNQTPRDLDVPQLDAPIPFQIDDGRLNYRMVFSKLAVQPGIEIAGYSYSNGTAQGMPFIQSYRDRVEFTPSLTLSYDVAPLRSLVFVVNNSTARYTNQTPGSPTLNFNNFSALGGVSFDTGGKLRYRVLVGYATRHFSSSQFATISAPIVEASVAWNVTGLTTVTASAARYIQDGSSDSTVGYTETALKLAVDHEYLRNVLLNGHAVLYRDNYSQNQGTQTFYAVGTSATWLMNRHMRLVGSYEFSSRQSDTTALFNSPGSIQGFGASYADNRFLLQLKVGL